MRLGSSGKTSRKSKERERAEVVEVAMAASSVEKEAISAGNVEDLVVWVAGGEGGKMVGTVACRMSEV